MRLMLVAPPDVRVDAGGSDPIGVPLGALTDALVRAGHDVTLWAAPGSQTLAARRSVATPSRLGAAERDRYARLHVVAALSQAAGFDAVHLYGVEAPPELVASCAAPVSRTLLTGLPRTGEAVVTPSWAMHRALAGVDGARFLGAVYPGVDVDAYPFSDEADGYLLFTGPMSHARGLHAALTAAYRAERPLYLIGPAPAGRAVFDDLIEPFVAAGGVRYLGDLPGEERRAVVSRAAALLLPVATPAIDYSGIEALACGTPVVTLDGSASRELVVHGESGIVAPRLVDLPAVVDNVDLIDRRSCRRRAQHCFDARTTAEQYVRLFAGTTSATDWPAHPELEALDERTRFPISA
jgi:glycosyltransferase involved in cell wall biosynthesis